MDITSSTSTPKTKGAPGAAAPASDAAAAAAPAAPGARPAAALEAGSRQTELIPASPGGVATRFGHGYGAVCVRLGRVVLEAKQDSGSFARLHRALRQGDTWYTAFLSEDDCVRESVSGLVVAACDAKGFDRVSVEICITKAENAELGELLVKLLDEVELSGGSNRAQCSSPRFEVWYTPRQRED